MLCRVYEESESDTFLVNLEAAFEAKGEAFGDQFDWDPDETENAERWFQRLSSPAGQRYAKRFFGSARADRFEKAAAEDLRTSTPGIKKAMPHFMTVAYALDTCSAVPSSENTDADSPVLAMLLGVDQWLSGAVDDDFTFTKRLEVPSGHAIEVAHVATGLRAEASETALTQLEKTETPLVRKLQGAYEVIETSSDGVSQAAHSMVELIDRLFRYAFTEDEVIAWIDAHGKSTKGTPLVYLGKGGKVYPTKRGQAMCFICAGRDPDDSYDLYAAIAAAFVLARKTLEGFKHADTGNDIPAEMLDAIAQVEAGLVLVFRLAWLPLEDERRELLLTRLQAA